MADARSVRAGWGQHFLDNTRGFLPESALMSDKKYRASRSTNSGESYTLPAGHLSSSQVTSPQQLPVSRASFPNQPGFRPQAPQFAGVSERASLPRLAELAVGLPPRAEGSARPPPCFEGPAEHRLNRSVRVERVVDIFVDKRVEVPYTKQRVVENVSHRSVPVPMITTREVNIPLLTVLDQPLDVPVPLRLPVERPVERVVDVPHYRERELYQDIEIELPLERVREAPVPVLEEVDVPYLCDVPVPRRVEKTVEKVLELQRVVKRPVCRPRVVERYETKIVEKRVEVPVERIVEVPHYVEVRKPVTLERRVQKPRIVERRSKRPLRRSVVHEQICPGQRLAFDSVSEKLVGVRAENFKLELEIETLGRQLAGYARVAGDAAAVERDNAQMQQRIEEMERELRRLQCENAQLAAAGPLIERQAVDAFSPADLRVLEADIVTAEVENRRLREAIHWSIASTREAPSAFNSKHFGAQSELSARRLPQHPLAPPPPTPVFKSSLPARLAESMAPVVRRTSPVAWRAGAMQESLLFSPHRLSRPAVADLPFTRAYFSAVQR